MIKRYVSRPWKLLIGLISIVMILCVGFVQSAQASPQPLASLIPGQRSLTPQLGVIYLENRFVVKSENLSSFLERWEKIGRYMKQQPGFVSAELKKDILAQDWLMQEKWNSLSDYKLAVSSPEFRALIQDFPAQSNWLADDVFKD
jgi:quinol monooxygenase YgiN